MPARHDTAFSRGVFVYLHTLLSEALRIVGSIFGSLQTQLPPSESWLAPRAAAARSAFGASPSPSSPIGAVFGVSFAVNQSLRPNVVTTKAFGGVFETAT
jgi:hypothetical protein